jgi:formylglycine-generating enzyme required for sulfatase activity
MSVPTSGPPTTVQQVNAPAPDPLQAALDAARGFGGSNADWRQLYRNGFQHTFEDEVPMVLVPAGSFIIGANPQTEDEHNGSLITFNEPFWIDLTEVTQADFERLGGVNENGNCLEERPNRPVTCITWAEARDFCKLRGGRLPTEAEWEYAARGPAGWNYPWGDIWNPNNAVWDRRSRSEGTADVGSIAAGRSWVGAFDMSGNVWEWVSSLYLPYNSTKDREADTGDSKGVRRVLRGGSWLNSGDLNFLRAGYRGNYDPEWQDIKFGFRCVRPS